MSASFVAQSTSLNPPLRNYLSLLMPAAFAVFFVLMQYGTDDGFNWLLVSLFVQLSVHYIDASGRRRSADYVGAQVLTTAVASSVALYGFEGGIPLLLISWVLLKRLALNDQAPLLPLSFGEGLLFFGIGHWRIKRTTADGRPQAEPHYYVLGALVVILFFVLYNFASTGFGLLMKDVTTSINETLMGTIIAATILGVGLLRHPFVAQSLPIRIMLGTNRAAEAPAREEVPGLFRVLNLTVGLLVIMAAVAVISDAQLMLSGRIANYTQQVHESVGFTIVSVLLAIGLILIIRYTTDLGGPNFSLTIKLLYAYLGINVGLLFNALMANQYYVNNYGLTHLRLGVYFYLTVVLVGLLLTAIYLYRNKQLVWLINGNFWSAYCALALFLLLPTDIWVARSQLQLPAANRELDYVRRMDDYALPVLFEYKEIVGEKFLQGRMDRLQQRAAGHGDFRNWIFMDMAAINQLKAQGALPAK